MRRPGQVGSVSSASKSCWLKRSSTAQPLEPMGFLDSGGRQAKSNDGSVGRLVAADVTASEFAFHPRSRTDQDPGVVDFRPITLDRQPCWPYHNDSSQVVQSQGALHSHLTASLGPGEQGSQLPHRELRRRSLSYREQGVIRCKNVMCTVRLRAEAGWKPAPQEEDGFPDAPLSDRFCPPAAGSPQCTALPDGADTPASSPAGTWPNGIGGGVRSQTRTVRSTPHEARYRPPGRNATRMIVFSWPRRATCSRPVAASQTRTTRSSPAAAKDRPSGLKATLKKERG